MNPQLAAAFAAHKAAIFGVAAAGAVGLGLWTKKKKGAAPATSAGPTSSIAGTLPAAAVVAPSLGGAYDSSAFDAYNALQPELEQILQTQGRGVTAAPAPIASQLFAPAGSGTYVRYGSSIGEVESDGSIFAPTLDQWQQLAANGAKYSQVSGQDSALPKYYNTAGNLAAKNRAGS